jgi:SNF2 family DNA or RNA helicase
MSVPVNQIKSELRLLPHQDSALEWMEKRETSKGLLCGGVLGMKMGLGKTFTTLSQIVKVRNSLDEGEREPTLVICPKTAIYTWKNEIEKFYGSSLKILIYRKDETKLDLLTLDILLDFDIVLTNYEYVRSLANKLKIVNKVAILDEYDRIIGMNVPLSPPKKDLKGESLIFSVNWFRIVADESHNFANHKTSLWQSMMCICGRRRWCLTGTPIRNYGDDLYSQFMWLGYKSERFDYKTFSKLNLSQYLNYVDYEKADVKLPEVFHQRIPIKLAERQAEMYNYYLNCARQAYKDFIIGTKNFSNVLTLFLRLRQVCIAPFTITPSSQRGHEITKEEMDEYLISQKELKRSNPGLVEWLHTRDGSSGLEAEKIKRAIDIITSIPPGEKVVVFTMFKRVIDLLQSKLNLASEGNEGNSIIIDGDITGKMRDLSLNSFKNSPKHNVLFISYKIGCESLNLTEANHLILMEPWWCPAVVEQAKARCHRMGQNKDTHIYELFIEEVENSKSGSIETHIVDLCNKKLELAANYLEKGYAKKGKEGGAGINADMMRDILFD